MVSVRTPKVSFKKDEILVLLGAGASVDAGIPHSAQMVKHIEDALKLEWAKYRDLYNYVRSAIHYADGIRGTYQVSYNIERLVVSLDELSQREEHPLYPFIGAWNPRLTQVAGPDFEMVAEFRSKILEKLRHQWIEITNYEKASYYSGLIRFQKEFNYPLKIFSLNYDLCVEKAYQAEYHEFPERGFDKTDRCWSHLLLEDNDLAERSLYLYKLHGSIDWMRDQATGRLTFSDSSSAIKEEDIALIFGTSYKLQYVDPFLFLVYQLRRLSLEARLIVVVGYGFCDLHINGILGQALRSDSNKRLLAVLWNNDDDTLGEKQRQQKLRRFVADQLELEQVDDRVNVIFATAKQFLGEQLSLAMVSGYFPPEEDIFQPVSGETTTCEEIEVVPKLVAGK
jgi:SIR2-like domain